MLAFRLVISPAACRLSKDRGFAHLLLFVLASFSAVPSWAQAPGAAAILDAIEPFADAGRFAGVVRVEHDGELIFERAYGYANVELEVPNSPSTRFHLHSLTKPFTAAAVLRAVDQGKLRLSDSICERLDPCPPRWAPVTVLQLLNHTAGIPDFTGSLLSSFSGTTAETYVAIQDELRELEVSEPGSTFRYSNSGYVLLELILEAVYGRPFGAVLAAEILSPAGLDGAGVQAPPPATGYDGPPVVARLASGYNGRPGALQRSMPKMYVIPGAGGVYATAADVAAFANALFAGDLLSPVQRSEMTRLRPQIGADYGLGIVIKGDGEDLYFRHDGGNNGYLSWLQFYPERGLTVVILSNFGFAPIRELAAAVVAPALDALAAPDGG